MTNLPLHIKLFNDKVRAMNQSNSMILTLNQQEARSLHAEIYNLMATISYLSQTAIGPDHKTEANMDGGSF